MRLEEVNRLPDGAFVQYLGGVFEGSPWVAEATAGKRPFEDISALHEAMVAAVQRAGPERRTQLIEAHPDLAGKAAVASTLTEESAREQSSAGLDRLTQEEFEEFTRLNRAYRARFGIPMIFCVREHTKGSILNGARQRLENSLEQEHRTALEEVYRISCLRLRDLITPEEGGE